MTRSKLRCSLRGPVRCTSLLRASATAGISSRIPSPNTMRMFRATSPTCAGAAPFRYADSVAGRFITFEGVEGVGKSTQIARAAEHLRSRGIDPLVTREPGGTVLAEKLRGLVLDPKHGPVGATAELLILFAARASHVAEVIRPALDQGPLHSLRPVHRHERGLPGWGPRPELSLDPPACGDCPSRSHSGPDIHLRRACDGHACAPVGPWRGSRPHRGRRRCVFRARAERLPCNCRARAAACSHRRCDPPCGGCRSRCHTVARRRALSRDGVSLG